MKRLNQGSIRLQNIYRLIDALRSHPGIARKEMAQYTSLSLMTVTNLVDILEKNHALAVLPQNSLNQSSGEVGRKAEITQLSSLHHIWFYLDLTELYFSFHGFTLNSEAVFEGVRHDYDKERTYETNLKLFLESIRKTIEDYRTDREVIGIAVSVPGPYNYDNDTVKNVRIPQLNEIHIRKILQENLGDYNYYIDEDVKFAIRAYTPMDWAQETAIQYYLYIGIGVGGAAILGDQVLKGVDAVAGDIGQIYATADKTYEQLISLSSFAAKLGAIPQEDIQKSSNEELLEIVGNYVREHHNEYEHILHETAELIGHMLHIVTWMLSPVRIIVDCKYASWAQQSFAHDIIKTLDKLINNRLDHLPNCVFVSANTSAVITGATQSIIYRWVEKIL